MNNKTNCNCKQCIYRIPSGNPFKLRLCPSRIAPRQQDATFEDIADLKANLTRANGNAISVEYELTQDGDIIVSIPDNLKCVTYGLELSGKYRGDAWKWKDCAVFTIVDCNKASNVQALESFAPDTYDLYDEIIPSIDDETLTLETHGHAWTNNGMLYIMGAENGDSSPFISRIVIMDDHGNVISDSLMATADRETAIAEHNTSPDSHPNIREDIALKVDDVRVNGTSVVSDEGGLNVANIIGIESASAEIDNEVGEPSVIPTIVNGDLHFEMHNLKGQKGDPMTFEDLNPSQKLELRGERGDSVIVGEGDMPLANELGDSDQKAITQQAATNGINNVARDVAYDIYNFTANTYWNWNTGGNGGSANSYAKTSIIPIKNIIGLLDIVTTRTSYYLLYLVVYNSETTASASTYLGNIDLNAAGVTSFTKQYILDRYPEALGVTISLKATSANTSLDTNTVKTQWHLKRIDSLSARVEDAEKGIVANASDIAVINGDITSINGELSDQDTRIGNLKKDVDGFTFDGFLANKMRQTNNGNYNGTTGARGYAISPVLDLSDNLGILQMINIGSRNAAWLSVYSNVLSAPNASGTHIGYIDINDSSFDPKQLIETKGWTETAKSAILTIRKNTSGTALDADVVATWQLKRTDSLRIRLDTMEEKLDAMKERKGVFVYDSQHNSESYVQSDLTDEKTIKASFRVDRVGSPTNNPCFCFGSTSITNKETGALSQYTASDDNGPAKYNRTYIGANHGDAFVHSLTCENHGKTYEDIGSKWYYAPARVTMTIISITDENHLLVYPEPSSSTPYPMWNISPNLNRESTGTYTHVDGATHQEDMVVTAVGVDNQLRKAMVVTDLKVLVDGKDVTGEGGTYEFAKLEICEIYDVFNTISILRKIQEGAGTFTANPVLAELGADKVARHTLVYTYVGADLWFINYNLTLYQDVYQFDLVNVTQQLALSSGVRMYIPKMLPFYGVDYRTICNSFAIDGTDKAVTSEYWENPLLPPDRWLQYNSVIGLASGILPDYGIGGTRRKDYVSEAMVFSTVEKTYLHMADAKVRPVKAGDTFSAIAFRRYIDPSKINQDGVICCNVFEYDGKLYIYADYNAAGLYEIDIPSKYLGKKVEIFEKRGNVTLLNEISASKLLVKVEEDEVMYGYIVAIIK